MNLDSFQDSLQFDIENLSEKDQDRVLKKVNEIQQGTLLRNQILEMTEFCFKKCYPKIKSSKEKADSICVMNCVERFFDATEVVAQSFPQGNQT
jgi:hypothetical protein